MRCFIKFSRILFLTTFVISLLSFQALAMDDAIIAVVNDEVVTLKDLKDYVKSTYVSLVAQGMEEEQLKVIMAELETNGIKKLIEDKLILTKANAIGLEVNDKVVDERMEEIIKKYPSEQAFLDGLVSNGASITDLRNKVMDQFKIQYVIDHQVKSKVHVNPREVTRFYEENINDFILNERVELDSIYIAFAGNPEKARKRSAEALELINGNMPFAEVNQRYSDTPSIGMVERGQILEKIDQVVFYLEDEEVSPAIEVDNGIYIFKLIKKIPSQSAALDEVKEKITNFLYRKELKERFDAWLAKLNEEAYVEIK